MSSSGHYLARLVVLQPALQVGSVGSGVKAAVLKNQHVSGGWGAGYHYCVESVVEGCGVLVGPLMLSSTQNTWLKHYYWPKQSAESWAEGWFCSYLIPGISSVWRVDEDSQDFSFGQQGCGSFGGYVWVEVAGALLKHVVRAGVGGEWEELHVPDRIKLQVNTWYWCTSSLNRLLGH